MTSMRFVLTCLISFLLCSCGTIAPKDVSAASPTYSGNRPDGGVLAVHGDRGIQITQSTNDVYNALIGGYGDKFTPALKINEGITRVGSSIWIDRQHFVYYALMKRWHRMGKPPEGMIDRLLNKIK